MFLVWVLFGALFGYAASQRRGFSATMGVLGGMLLGIFSPLMFFVSSELKKCPSCAEWVQKDATICKHCHATLLPSDSATRSSRTGVVLVGAGVLAVLVILIFVAFPAGPKLVSMPRTSTGNAGHDSLVVLPEDRRGTFLSGIIASGGTRCGAARRTFFQGIDQANKRAYWNIECSTGRSYSIAIEADAGGSTRFLDCALMTRIGVACFTAFGSRSAPVQETQPAAPVETVTSATLARLSEDMSYADAEAVFGRPGTDRFESTIAGSTTTSYMWWSANRTAYIRAVFINGRLATKGHYGLR